VAAVASGRKALAVPGLKEGDNRWTGLGGRAVYPSLPVSIQAWKKKDGAVAGRIWAEETGCVTLLRGRHVSAEEAHRRVEGKRLGFVRR
jgi:hypothetical protein